MNANVPKSQELFLDSLKITECPFGTLIEVMNIYISPNFDRNSLLDFEIFEPIKLCFIVHLPFLSLSLPSLNSEDTAINSLYFDQVQILSKLYIFAPFNFGLIGTWFVYGCVRNLFNFYRSIILNIKICEIYKNRLNDYIWGFCLCCKFVRYENTTNIVNLVYLLKFELVLPNTYTQVVSI